jgi:hypothetical protein
MKTDVLAWKVDRLIVGWKDLPDSRLLNICAGLQLIAHAVTLSNET